MTTTRAPAYTVRGVRTARDSSAWYARLSGGSSGDSRCWMLRRPTSMKQRAGVTVNATTIDENIAMK